jgi:6-phosphofructokinase 1
MKKIGVFTSGGDAPGMNACIRAVVRTACYYKKTVVGILHGFDGMIRGQMVPLGPQDVSNIIHRGGTMLKTSRSKEFMTKVGMRKAYESLKRQNIEGLIAIGGDGTFKGCVEFSQQYGIPIIGVPGTIDNDLYGTDYTLGFDTAINTTLDAIDKIKETAASHDRLFFIEVMGRDTGYLALYTGIASGADEILLPETQTDISSLIKLLKSRHKQGKSSIVIVAEGDEAGGAMQTAARVKEKLPEIDIRITILGHIQRGGSPTCFDRILATRLGVAATEALLNNQSGLMAGMINNRLAFTPLENVCKSHSLLDTDLLRITPIMNQ